MGPKGEAKITTDRKDLLPEKLCVDWNEAGVEGQLGLDSLQRRALLRVLLAIDSGEICLTVPERLLRPVPGPAFAERVTGNMRISRGWQNERNKEFMTGPRRPTGKPLPSPPTHIWQTAGTPTRRSRTKKRD